MSSGQIDCQFCNNPFPDTRTHCPHCGRPQIFPNVTAAMREGEVAKLDRRFQEKQAECAADGREDVFERFRNAASSAHALFACTLERLHREIASGTDIWETYYQLEELRLRSSAPKSLDWAKLRPQAEIELLGSHQHIEQLHYACLSIDWASLTSYGECVVKLADQMIAHRASCFSGNTAVIYYRERSFANCLRSDWSKRGIIAVVVFEDRLSQTTADDEFAEILVSAGDDAVDDQFIEVHIFGPMTAKTFAEVKLKENPTGREAIYIRAVQEKLSAAGVTVLSGETQP